MITVTLGFATMDKNSPAECLYAGPDTALARSIAEQPPKEFARTAVFKNPIPTKRFVGPFMKPAPVLLPDPPAPEEEEPPTEPTEEETPTEPAEEAAPPAKEEKPRGLQGPGASRK